MGRKLFGGLFSSSQSSLACTCPELEMPGNLHLPWCVPKQMNVTEARKLSRLPQEEKTDSREQHLHSRASLGVRLRLELYSLPASPRSLSFMTHLNTNPHLWDCSGNLYEWIFSYRISICPPSSSFFFAFNLLLLTSLPLLLFLTLTWLCLPHWCFLGHTPFMTSAILGWNGLLAP